MTEIDIVTVGGTAIIATVLALFWAGYNFLKVDKSRVRLNFAFLHVLVLFSLRKRNN